MGMNECEGKIRIGFIVQMASLWDKQVDIYLEAKKRKNIETFIFVVPEDNWEDYSIANCYDNNYFLKEYPDAVKAHDSNGEIIDLRNWNLDYLFYPRPYDIHLPVSFRSYITSNYTICCYIPYGFTAADVFNEGNVYNPFFKYIYFCFMDSSYMKRLFDEYYSEYIKRRLKRVEYLGYPCLLKYIKMGNSDSLETITWAPRWSYDSKLGGSNFLEYKDAFIELQKQHQGKCIFRPHPLMFDELVHKGLMSKEEVDTFVGQLEENNVIVDIDSPIDKVLAETDVLISDFSTIVGAFFLTGRPIIYCDKGIILNEIYSAMAQYMYVAKSWEDVKQYYGTIVVEKNDYKREERSSYIENNFGKETNAAQRIIDVIIEDYGMEG